MTFLIYFSIFLFASVGQLKDVLLEKANGI